MINYLDFVFDILNEVILLPDCNVQEIIAAFEITHCKMSRNLRIEISTAENVNVRGVFQISEVTGYNRGIYLFKN